VAARDDDGEPLVLPSDRAGRRAGEVLAEQVLRPFQVFARRQTSGGVVLFACTVLALAWANSPWADLYFGLLHEPFGVSLGEHRIAFDLHHWINDALMAVFFFAVGLEIKRELLVGELAEPRKALGPIAAAAGGMLVPALIYLAFNAGGPGRAGWGIPMATDIAFALGALTVLGRRVPEALKVFLVALAIADDLGAVLVIAIFYTSEIVWGGLGLALVFMAGLVTANLAGARHPLVYLLLGVGLWYGLLTSGVHATLSGVLAAFTIPARARIVPGALAGLVRRGADRLEERQGEAMSVMDPRRVATIMYLRRALEEAKTPLQRFEYMVNPWVTFGIMPVFGFFNAGVALDPQSLARLASSVPVGIAAGLVVGKQAGVFLASWLAVASRLASLPEGVTWRQMYGMAWLAGIGFTMSLFINGLAFGGTATESDAKLGILLGSLVSAAGGVLVLVAGRTEASSDRVPVRIGSAPPAT
jgi:NhaA family Na+:H+ antiporter